MFCPYDLHDGKDELTSLLAVLSILARADTFHNSLLHFFKLKFTIAVGVDDLAHDLVVFKLVEIALSLGTDLFDGFFNMIPLFLCAHSNLV